VIEEMKKRPSIGGGEEVRVLNCGGSLIPPPEIRVAQGEGTWIVEWEEKERPGDERSAVREDVRRAPEHDEVAGTKKKTRPHVRKSPLRSKKRPSKLPSSCRGQARAAATRQWRKEKPAPVSSKKEEVSPKECRQETRRGKGGT